MSLFRSSVLQTLFARREPGASAVSAKESRTPAPAFSPADWNELFMHWREVRTLGPARVIPWRERREVGRYINLYPADELICRGGRYGLQDSSAQGH